MTKKSSTTNDFQLWLSQKVWVSATEKATRRSYIPEFAEDITSFMKVKGYQMDSRWRRGHMAVARWLYAIHVNIVRGSVSSSRGLSYPPIFHRDWVEDNDQFYHVIEFNDIQELLNRWHLNEDLDTESVVGQRTLYEFHQLLWTYIDLDSSNQGILVATRLEESDSESEGQMVQRGQAKRRADTYIQDATEGYHGGGWAKV